MALHEILICCAGFILENRGGKFKMEVPVLIFQPGKKRWEVIVCFYLVTPKNKEFFVYGLYLSNKNPGVTREACFDFGMIAKKTVNTAEPNGIVMGVRINDIH
jgi:hypothetical protein